MCRFAGVCHSLFALSNAAQEANRAQVTALEAYQYSRCFVRLQPASLTGLYSNKTQHKPLQGQLLAHERYTVAFGLLWSGILRFACAAPPEEEKAPEKPAFDDESPVVITA